METEGGSSGGGGSTRMAASMCLRDESRGDYGCWEVALRCQEKGEGTVGEPAIKTFSPDESERAWWLLADFRERQCEVS